MLGRDAGMSLMSVLRAHVSGNRNRRIRHRGSVFAKWHCHRAVTLQGQPQRNESNNPVFPATTHLRIISKFPGPEQS